MRRLRPTALVASTMLLLAACGLQNQAGGSAPTRSSTGVGGEINVLAAASLAEAFTEIGASVEDRHTGLRVNFSFGPSSGLAEQIVLGAPADVFASADTKTMQRVVDEQAVTAPPVVFARNTLQIAVPPGNPAGIHGLADFARADLHLALCAPEVPCGSASTAVFKAAQITPRADTLESDVKAALSKVVLGEVDAALVYRTDVLAAGDKVAGIDFPQAEQAVNDYPIAELARSPNRDGAAAFVRAVQSGEGRAVLAKHGFVLP